MSAIDVIKLLGLIVTAGGIIASLIWKIQGANTKLGADIRAVVSDTEKRTATLISGMRTEITGEVKALASRLSTHQETTAGKLGEHSGAISAMKGDIRDIKQAG